MKDSSSSPRIYPLAMLANSAANEHPPREGKDAQARERLNLLLRRCSSRVAAPNATTLTATPRTASAAVIRNSSIQR